MPNAQCYKSPMPQPTSGIIAYVSKNVLRYLLARQHKHHGTETRGLFWGYRSRNY